MKIYKIILIGDQGVGKTSIQTRYINSTFSKPYEITIGVEFGVKELAVKGEKIKLHLWDTAGQERFRSICRSYYRGSDCAIIVYDVTKLSSFESVRTWIEDLHQMTNDFRHIYVVGNKCDLVNKVTKNEIEKLLCDFPCVQHFHTSAKNGTNIVNLFTYIGEDCVKHIPKNDMYANINLIDHKQRSCNNNCCQ